jgi:hypothetical protein
MQKREFLRLTVSYRAEDHIYAATLNGREISGSDDNASRQGLQSYMETMGDEGSELVTGLENHLVHETFHFIRLVE